MSNTALVTTLSDAELDEVGGGFLGQFSQNNALSLNVAVLTFGQTAQANSTNQQSANSVSWGGRGSRIYQRISSYTEAEAEND